MYLRNCLRGCILATVFALALIASEHHGRVEFGGLPLPGATVTLSQGNTKFTAIADPQGAYSFPEVTDGSWTIQVEMLCFAPLKQDLIVGPGAPSPVWELKLLPMEQIQAAGGSPAVTAPALAVLNSDPRAIQAAPSRAKTRLAPAPANTPGAFQRAELNASNAPPANEPEPSGEVLQRSVDGFLINGAANNGANSPFALGPAFGNSRKGPRSLYNGNIGLIADNSMLDARPFSLTGQDTPKLAYNHLTGIVSFGGPLKIPHLLRNGPNLTLDYQWTRNRNASTLTGLMPNQAERAGDFSQALNPLGRPIQVYDSTTGLPFPGNVIPQSRISRQSRSLLNFYPLSNFNGGSRYNYQIAVAGITHQDSLQSRVNKAIGRKNQITGTFAFQSTRMDNSNLFGFLDTVDTLGLNSGFNWRHTFTPRFYTNVGYAFSRLSSRTTPYFENRENVSAIAGIAGNNQDPVNWGPPSLSFASGIAGLSDAQQSRLHNQTDALTLLAYWNHGRHGLSFGGDFRKQQFNLLAQQDPRGTFTFTGAATQASSNGTALSGTGSDFAGFLLGVPDTSAIAFGNADKYLRSSYSDAFFTDDWRISPGFTLNAGVRWEYGSPITELYGRLVNLDLANGFAAAAPVIAANPTGPLTGTRYPDSLIRPDKHAFQPRVAISWRPLPASSMVVRGGYGVYYNTSVYQMIALQMAQQSPLSKSLSVQNSPANPLTLANGFNASPATTLNTFAIDPNFRVGYAQNWQLSVQRDLPGALVMTATYLGIRGTRAVQQSLPNTFPAGAPNPCQSCPVGFAYLASNGNSTREAGQFQLRRRLHNGVTASVQYTYSKSVDDAALGGRNQGTAVIAQNWLDLSAERGPSSFDQRHQVTMQMQYSTGMGVGGGTLLSGWRGALCKEWTLVSQIDAGTGLPLTPVYLGAVDRTGVTGSIRPDYTGAPLYSAPSGFFLNSSAYAPATGHWGNAGRDSITGPSQFSLNASLGRTFRVSDRLSLDLRVNSSNALNHVTFPSWNTIVNSAQFGLPNMANPMRSVQTTLRVRF